MEALNQAILPQPVSSALRTARPIRSSAAHLALIAVALLGFEPCLAIAQQPAGIVAGAQIKDANGGVVGTVTAVTGDLVTVKTDRNEVQLPKSAFTPSAGALLFGMTQQQLNAAVDKQKASAAAKVAVGAKVTDPTGAVVGTIESIDAQYATLKLTSGKVVKLARSGLAPGSDGAVIGTTAAALEAAANSSSTAK